MGNNQNRGNSENEEINLDGVNEQDLRMAYRRYIERNAQREASRPKKQKYRIDQTDEEYVIFTNNLFEAKVKRSIYKQQDQFYSNYYRKLRMLPNRMLAKRFQKQNHLQIPSNNNYASKIMQDMLPNKRVGVDEINSGIYNILFSQDTSQLLVTTQVEKFINIFEEALHVYSSTNGEFERGKVLIPRNITWTITDSDLSSSGKFLIHCSLNPFISIFDIHQGKYSNFYNLNDNSENIDEEYWSRLRFFSCKFSGDDSKIIASSGRTYESAMIKVFDVAGEQVIDNIQAHKEDINSVAFLHRHNSTVFVSGSDDRLVKIWDTRALGPRGQAAGQFLGHVAGITNVDSRQDHFYVASNSKDSTVKLWDLRKSETSSASKPRKDLSFDYRGQALSERLIEQIRGLNQSQNFDNSVMTFRGHKVGRTLMRCHFSPLSPTDRRFIYVASYCGKVFVYDILSGMVSKEMTLEKEKNVYTAAILDDKQGVPMRDAAWHPDKMEIISTNLKGNIYKWYNGNIEEDSDNLDREEAERGDESMPVQRNFFDMFHPDYDDDEGIDEIDREIDSQDVENRDDSQTDEIDEDEKPEEEEEEEEEGISSIISNSQEDSKVRHDREDEEEDYNDEEHEQQDEEENEIEDEDNQDLNQESNQSEDKSN